jgi:hypothetical protein
MLNKTAHNNKIYNQKSNNNDEDMRNENIRIKLANLVRDSLWNDILQLITDNPLLDINVSLFNGNNLFHLACIKGETDFIKRILKLKNENKLFLNINMFNYEGESGPHLYYKYGGNDPFLLSDNEMCYVNENNFVLAKYLIGNIDLLELLINKMIQVGCIENIGIRDDDYMFTLLMAKEIHYSKIDKNMANRYLDIIRKLNHEIKPPNLVFMAVDQNCIDVIKMFMMFDFNFNIVSREGVSIISKCVRHNRLKMLVIILEYTKLHNGNLDVFKLINRSDIHYDARPIFISIDLCNMIMFSTLIQFMRQYVEDTELNTGNKIILDYTDSSHNTYLQWLLVSKCLVDTPNDIIQFLIEHTDINHENYAGVTSAHLLFGKGIWKKFKSSLIGREIDLLKVDDLNNNCYSYISAADKEEFLDLTTKIILPINIKNTKDINKFFNVNTMENLITSTHNRSDESIAKNIENIGSASIDKIKSNNYGLFNANLHHYMLYLKYIQNKHISMYVPVQEYDLKTIKRDMFFFNMVSTYETSQEQSTIVRHVRLYQQMYYSYLPHNIYWINDDCHYIHPKLITILSKHNNDINVNEQRYVMVKISIIVSKNLLHANSLIYDRLNKEAWRFEPYGTTQLTNTGSMDKKLQEILTDVYGKITYHDPDTYLNGLNFQMVDGEDFILSKNLGDPGGYCLAWSLWFIDTVLSHPDKNVKYIMRNFFNRSDINTLLSVEEGQKIQSNNYYLDFIRRYAQRLDKEKNYILEKLGIKKYYMYNTIFKENVTIKIEELFKVISHNPTEKDIKDKSSFKINV